MKNLFDFATKELSQDAFICWLVNNYDSDNKELKRRAYDFINFLSGDSNKFQLDSILRLKTQQQVQDMDVIIDIWTTPRTDKEYEDTATSDYVIIVEDKTDTSAHNEQLLRYGQKIDNWTKWKSSEKKDSRKVFYKSNYLSWQDVKELNRYIHSKNDKTDFDLNDPNHWYIKPEIVWNEDKINQINNKYKDCWNVYDIDSIYEHFKEKKGKSEIYDSFVQYIKQKHDDLSAIEKPNEHNVYKWLSFFRRTVAENISIKDSSSWWIEYNMYGYAYFAIRVKPFEEDGAPYLEIRSRDCCYNEFIARILTYGLDDSKKYGACASDIRESIKTEIGKGTYARFKANKNGNKQIADTGKIKLKSNDEFFMVLQECIEEFKQIMNNIKG